MSHLLFLDGQFYRDDKAIAGAHSRALRYGDGLFETMICVQGRIPLEELHYERLFQGMHLLGFDTGSVVQPAYFREKIRQLLHRNGQEHAARIRLMVMRGDGAPFDIHHQYPHHLVQTEPLPAAHLHWQENGYELGFHHLARKSMDALANCKSNNYLPSLLAGREAKQQKWNDAILLNNAGRVCETSIANVFFLREGQWHTPALTEGPVAGTLRRYIIEKLSASGETVLERPVETTELLNAEEIFVCNAVYGIRSVQKIGEKIYSQQATRKLYDALIAPLLS